MFVVVEQVNYLSKVTYFNEPHLHFVLPLGVTPFEFCQGLWRQKTTLHGLLCGVVSVILHFCRFDTILVCDGHTHTQRRHIPCLHSVTLSKYMLIVSDMVCFGSDI